MTAATPIPIAGRAAAADREAWVERCGDLVRAGNERQWESAAWFAEGVDAFGEDFVRDGGRAAGVRPGNISRFIAFSRAKHVFRYRKRLGFHVVAEVVRLPEADADRILGNAETGGWSVKQVRAAAREAGVEGKLRRQRDEINRLRAENARLKLDHATALAGPTAPRPGSRPRARRSRRRTARSPTWSTVAATRPVPTATSRWSTAE